MSEIVLSVEQDSIVASAEGVVAVRRSDGSLVGYFRPMTGFIKPSKPPFTPEEIAAALQDAENSSGPWHTTQEVLEHLRSLDRRQP